MGSEDRGSYRIFGFYARGEEKEASDVDVLVEFVKTSFDNFMDLAFFLEDLFEREVVQAG